MMQKILSQFINFYCNYLQLLWLFLEQIYEL